MRDDYDFNHGVKVLVRVVDAELSGFAEKSNNVHEREKVYWEIMYEKHIWKGKEMLTSGHVKFEMPPKKYICMEM